MSGQVATNIDAMNATLARNWWAVALRGAFAILFGLAALLLPLATVASLVLLFAVYMLADGVFAIVAGVRAAAKHERWGLLILEGIVDLAAGAAALLLPGLTVLVMVTVLGVWAVVSGIVMFVAAFRLHLAHGRWLLAAGAIGLGLGRVGRAALAGAGRGGDRADLVAGRLCAGVRRHADRAGLSPAGPEGRPGAGRPGCLNRLDDRGVSAGRRLLGIPTR